MKTMAATMIRVFVLGLTLLLALAVLTGCGQAAAVPTGKPDVAAAESASSYQVLVLDESGNPVPGAMIQFCSDVECSMAKTDDSGIATFDKEAGSYTVHVLKVPEGFAPDETEYTAPAEPALLTIMLQKQE